MTATMPELAPVDHIFRSMGTSVSVTLPPDYPAAAGAVREVMDAWDVRFSRFRTSSELSRLNASDGATFPATPELRSVIHAAIEAARSTDGIFDPLLGQRMAELGYDRTFDAIEPRRLAPPVPWIAGRWRDIVVDDRLGTVQLPPGAGLDLGGIAKGMAVDAAVAELVRMGVPYGAVNAGGDLALHGDPPSGDGWSILVEGQGERVVTLDRGALATSTVLERRWSVDGQARHHLLDPRTGLPAEGDIVLASVAAPTCAEAEVAAKVALLSGSVDGEAYLRRVGLPGLLVRVDGLTRRIGMLGSPT